MESVTFPTNEPGAAHTDCILPNVDPTPELLTFESLNQRLSTMPDYDAPTQMDAVKVSGPNLSKVWANAANLSGPSTSNRQVVQASHRKLPTKLGHASQSANNFEPH
ncbi:hypothetical protein [Luteibacter sp. ME-Dv--P-043b]|uniref:hypothetical protein n=1 Tax=Luteibacter sp. ME-Dv--P-043b TaxID=3040291 RepID=UPI00255691F9|nr:hypothetical protein [Luteibacter sp. ME-Dv--P-043b]